VTKWAAHHPGGSKLLLYYKGEDATDVFVSMHTSDKPQTFMSKYAVGTIAPGEFERTPSIVKDFRQLRAQLEKEGMFVANPIFFTLSFLQVRLRSNP
jgi:cytochrome b involved in lipid metabolism